MPSKYIDVRIEKLFVSRVAAMWGPGKWYVDAKIDGTAVGDKNKKHLAQKTSPLSLGRSWGRRVDISGKGAGSSVKVEIEVFEVSGIFSRRTSLGKAETTIKFPYLAPFADRRVNGSPVKQGKTKISYFETSFSSKCESVASVPSPSPTVLVSRQHDGSSKFTTMARRQVTPRVEICPVVPTPPRANLPPFNPAPGLAPPKETRWARVVPITANLKLNRLANPSLIPVLNKSDRRIANKAARIAVTYYHPGNLDTSKFHWKIKTGPISFHGSSKGVSVLVYGLAGAIGSDKMAELELRWESDTGPLLATYRAWVGEIMEVRYRVNLIRGPTIVPRTKPQHIPDQIKKANVHMWQSGIVFVPDRNPRRWDGAKLGKRPATRVSKEGWVPGVFQIRASNDDKTALFDPNIAPLEQNRWNFRPNVLQINYFKSFGGSGAGFYGFATDEPGTLAPQFSLAGSPSSSWRRKSGLPGDKPAQPVKMKTLPRSRPRAAGKDRKSSAAVLAAEQADLAAIAATDSNKNTAKQHAEYAGHYQAVAKKIWKDADTKAKARRQAANADKKNASKRKAASKAEKEAREARVEYDKSTAAANRATASYNSVKSPGDPAPAAATDGDRTAAEPFCDQRTNQDADDVTAAKARKLSDSDMQKLFALVQSDFQPPGHFDWGANIAHEAAHVLGLAHRGSGGNPPAQGDGSNGPSADGVNDPNGSGYPYHENVMGYTQLKCQDFDLIQTQVMREHPLCVRLSEKPKPPKLPPRKPKKTPPKPPPRKPKKTPPKPPPRKPRTRKPLPRPPTKDA